MNIGHAANACNREFKKQVYPKLLIPMTFPFFLGLGEGPHKINAATTIAIPTLANTATLSTSMLSELYIRRGLEFSHDTGKANLRDYTSNPRNERVN